MADTKKTSFSPMAAGIAGGLVGAAVAAGAMALSNPQTRKKAGEKIKDLHKYGNNALGDLKTKTTEVAEDAKSAIGKSDDIASDLDEALKEAQKTSSRATSQK